jgi:hypothetical protein
MLLSPGKLAIEHSGSTAKEGSFNVTVQFHTKEG